MCYPGDAELPARRPAWSFSMLAFKNTVKAFEDFVEANTDGLVLLS